MTTEGSGTSRQSTDSTLSVQQCRDNLMESFGRLTRSVALDPILVRSLTTHDDPALQLEALILRANHAVMYTSARDAAELLDLAADAPLDVWAQIRTPFAWLAKHGTAHVMDELGRPTDSLTAAIEASDLAIEGGILHLAAISRSMFGHVLSRQGDSAAAAFTLAEASEEMLTDERSIGLADYYLARTHEREGDVDGAVHHFLKAVDSPVQQVIFGSYRSELARLLAKVGRIDEATSALAAARRTLRVCGEPPKVLNRYLVADAHLDFAQGNFTQAARKATRARNSYQRRGFAILELPAIVLLAKSQLRLNDPASAVATLKEMNNAIAGPFARLEAAETLSKCYRALDDPRNEAKQLREANRLSAQLRRSAHITAQMARVVAENTSEALKAVVVKAERDDLQERKKQNAEAIAMACHDLRGSLSIVTLAAESLARSTTGPKLKEQLFSSIEAMDQLVSQLNSISELDQAMIQLGRAPVQLGELAQSIVERLSALAATSSVALSIDRGGQERSVYGDPTAVERILTNFITNAITHCPTGTSVDVRMLPAPPSAVRITVVDNGPGIEGKDMALVFDKFVSGVDRSAPTSTGLGLFIARQLAFSMDGEVGVEPGDNGIGCCFWLELPATENH